MVGRERPFVGRADELAALCQALDDALAGRGSVVAVAGEPGIGKTRLVQELEHEAASRGVALHWGRTPEASASAAYWPWIRALRSLVEEPGAELLGPALAAHGGMLDRLSPDLAPGVPPVEMYAEEGAQIRLFDGITAFVVAAARARPLVLVLEDIHWADASSLLLLRYLAPEVAEAPLLLVVTYRDAEVRQREALRDAVGNLVRLGHFRAIRLQGLSVEAVRDYLREGEDREEPSPELVSQLLARTEGNPFFLAEMAALTGSETEAAALPVTLRAAIEQRLARLSRECNELLATAAVAGRLFGLDLLAAVTGHGEERLLDLLDEALAVGILEDADHAGGYQFHHALVQETLLDRLSAARRARLHGRIGEALEGLYGEAPEHAAELAHHFGEATATRASYAAQALEHTRRAAEHAERQFAWEEAADLYERCLAPATEPLMHLKNRAQVLHRLAIAHNYAGQIAQAWDASLAATDAYRELGDGRSFAQVALTLWWGVARSHGALVRLYSEALELVSGQDLELEGMLAARLTDPQISFAVGSQARERAARRLAEIMSLHDSPAIAAEELFSRGMMHWIEGEWAEAVDAHDEAARRFDALGYPTRASAAHMQSAWNLVNVGDLGGAGQRLEVGRHIARKNGLRRVENWHAHHFAMLSVLKGSPGDGIEEALERYDKNVTSQGTTPAFTTGLAWFLRVFRDDPHPERLAPSEPERRRVVQTWGWHATRVRELYRGGDVPGARRALDLFRAAMREHPPATWIGEEAVVATYYAAMDEAVAALADDTLRPVLRTLVVDPPKPFTAIFDLPTPICYVRLRGLYALSLDMDADAHRLFLEAASWCEREGCPVELGRSYQGLAEIAARQGDRAAALARLERAVALFDEHGALFFLREALEQKAQFLVTASAPNYPAGLSEREVEVLRLVALGRSNAQVAETLFISRATVARHVSNILNKTGLSNRTELAAFAVAQSLVEI
jgi:DNA-binding CsgD family transcriptional regulator